MYSIVFYIVFVELIHHKLHTVICAISNVLSGIIIGNT